MTLNVDEAIIEGYRSDSDPDAEPAYVYGNEHLVEVEISARAQNPKDTAEISVLPTGTYPRSGDLLRFKVARTGDAEPEWRWTGMVRDWSESVERLEPEAVRVVDIDAEDYVYTLCSFRRVYNTFVDRPIAGTDDAILDTILDHTVVGADPFDDSEIEEIDTTTDAFFDGTELLDAVKELRDRGRALMAAKDTALVFKPMDDLEPAFSLRLDDVELPLERDVEDDELRNLVRADGAEADALEERSAQEAVDDYEYVTADDRLLTQITIRKAAISNIEVWTNVDEDGDDLMVRIQADDGTGNAPVDEGSPQSDIVNHQLAPDFLADDGWTAFMLPDHTLPATDNVWIILDSTSDDGQPVGVNADGEPAIRPYFAYPIAASERDAGSIDRYRLREDRIRKDNLESVAAARDTVEARLRRDTTTRETFQVRAASERAHDLAVLDVVRGRLDVESFPRDDLLVVEKTERYANSLLETTLDLVRVTDLQDA